MLNFDIQNLRELTTRWQGIAETALREIEVENNEIQYEAVSGCDWKTSPKVRNGFGFIVHNPPNDLNPHVTIFTRMIQEYRGRCKSTHIDAHTALHE